MSRVLIGVGGAAAVLSGGASIAQQVWGVAVGGLAEGRGESALHSAQLLLLVPGVVGLYLVQERAMRGFGQLATLVALVGSVLMFGSALTEVTLVPELTAAGSPLADDPGATTAAVFLCSLVAWIAGLLLFGVATWRAGVLPRPAAALLVVGLVLGLGLDAIVPGVLVLYSAGLVWLGAAAARRAAAAPAEVPQAAPVGP
jgi:hypothetical protein